MGLRVCSQEPEEGVGKQGLVSSVALEPVRNAAPPLCPAVSHPAVLSLRAWDMLTGGGGYNLEEEFEALLERCKTISVPRGQDHKVLLLPEGPEALRAGAGGSQSCEAGRGRVTDPTQSYAPALGAFTPQCLEVTGGCQPGRQGTGRQGWPRAFTRLISGLFLHEGRGEGARAE